MNNELREFKQSYVQETLNKYLGNYEINLIDEIDDFIFDDGLPSTSLEVMKFPIINKYNEYIIHLQNILFFVEKRLKDAERKKNTVYGEMLNDYIMYNEVKNASERGAVISKEAPMVSLNTEVDELQVIRSYILNKYNLLLNILKLFHK